MQTFIDSTDLIADPGALQARLREQGYVFFKRLLDPAPLRALRSDMLRTVAEYGWLEEGTDPEDAIPSQPARWHSGEGWRSAYIAIQKLESFHRQAFDPDVIGMLTALLGDTPLAHGQRIARLIWPTATLTTPPHQDFTHIQGTADVITTWVPLSDVPAASGGLRILAGSHTKGVRKVELAPGAGGIRSLVEDDDPNWASVDYETGDIVAFHSLTVHGGRHNTSGRLRLSCDYRYQRLDDPVAPPSLRPHNCPYVPDWDELLADADWRDTPWGTPPRVEDIREFKVPVNGLEGWTESLEIPPSRFVDAPA